MKTTATQDQILYQLINGSPLDTLKKGGLYVGERPLNSRDEDVVITSMLIGTGTLQEGVAVVNIYIPKIYVSVAGKKQTMRDGKRIGEVLAVAQGILNEAYGKNYSLWTSRQEEYDEPEIGQTRVSFRIEFRIDKNL